MNSVSKDTRESQKVTRRYVCIAKFTPYEFVFGKLASELKLIEPYATETYNDYIDKLIDIVN